MPSGRDRREPLLQLVEGVPGSRQQVQTGLAIAEESFGNFAQYSKKAFRLQQAAGIANATISIAEGVSEAWSKGFPLGPIEAALIAAAGVAQIVAIKSQQPPQAFAKGGIIDSPTFFTARGVPRGLAGEAGPEAILPVKRMPSGKFGVHAMGGGTAIHTHNSFHVDIAVNGEVEDAEFTGQEVARGFFQHVEPLLNRWARDQHRAGGVFNPTDRI